MSLALYRRLLIIPLLLSLTVLLYIYRLEVQDSVSQTWRNTPSKDDLVSTFRKIKPKPHKKPSIPGGQLRPNGTAYTRTLVLARQASEDTSWISEALPDLHTAIYTVDDPNAALHPPQNKGHEAIVYLSYILDNYDSPKLADTSIFMHAHRFAWHNNELLDHDAVESIRRLSSAAVERQGYTNLRCHWDPGCPEWIHPSSDSKTPGIMKAEQDALAKSWAELFPNTPIPDTLGVPCCAQFALSRQAIRAIPRERYEYLRNWIINSRLSSEVIGRVFEYTWHYLFTAQAVTCPAMHVCYCDLYGICFRDEKSFNGWFELRYHRREAERQLKSWKEMEGEVMKVVQAGIVDESVELNLPEVGQDMWLKEDIRRFGREMENLLGAAMKDGDRPELRAKVAGRVWKEGDGF